jgi:hypothetical protein
VADTANEPKRWPPAGGRGLLVFGVLLGAFGLFLIRLPPVPIPEVETSRAPLRSLDEDHYRRPVRPEIKPYGDDPFPLPNRAPNAPTDGDAWETLVSHALPLAPVAGLALLAALLAPLVWRRIGGPRTR